MLRFLTTSKMNSSVDDSGRASEHTMSTGDEGQSPVLPASPALTSSDASYTSESDHATYDYIDPESEDPDVHQPDDAPPQEGDIVNTRGRPDFGAALGKPSQSSELSKERPSRGPKSSAVAQGYPPAGPSPIIGNVLLPSTRPGTPPAAMPNSGD
ncbi:hypothetical protein FRC07_013226 [Ceratobasidium sp. 392]|nr:hypothetical protein FRC07_013226 [Ceratobasidium sp. 392]